MKATTRDVSEFLDLEVKRKNDAFALKCIKEFVDDNILPLISEAKTAKKLEIPLFWSEGEC